MTPQEAMQRRQKILEFWCEHGATKTAREFGISRTRVYYILEMIRYGRAKPASMRKRRKVVDKQ